MKRGNEEISTIVTELENQELAIAVDSYLGMDKGRTPTDEERLQIQEKMFAEAAEEFQKKAKIQYEDKMFTEAIKNMETEEQKRANIIENARKKEEAIRLLLSPVKQMQANLDNYSK